MQTNDQVIEDIQFRKDEWGPTEVWVGSPLEVLFSYYPDEITFTRHDLMGLTHEQALALRHKRDVEYLQS